MMIAVVMPLPLCRVITSVVAVVVNSFLLLYSMQKIIAKIVQFQMT